MRRHDARARRWDAAHVPGDLPVAVPPARMAPLCGGRPLKRWRYVATFGHEVMLCAAVATVGPARSSWWAVWDRRTQTLYERTRIGDRGRRANGVTAASERRGCSVRMSA